MMTENTSHEQMRSLIAPFVLGAVDSKEEPAIRDHLLECDECRGEADGFLQVVSRLPLAVEAEPLPRGFSEGVLARVSEDRPVIGAPAGHRGRGRWVRWWSLLPAAALLAVSAVLGFALLDARNDLDLQQEVTAALLESEEGLRLSGRGAVAALVPADDGSVFVVDGLDTAPGEKIYQLWLLRGDGPVSAGTFDVEDGRALVRTDHRIGDFTGVAVTVEPEGGSPQPTTDPIMQSA